MFERAKRLREIFSDGIDTMEEQGRLIEEIRAENEKLRNVIAALAIAVRMTHSISEERLQEIIAIARGDEVVADGGEG